MKKSFKKPGFTLIELIIAVSIIAMVVGVFLANYYGSEPQSQLINATSALMRDLRSAQTRDTANVDYGSDSSLGWGINLVIGDSKYTLFADVDGNRVYSSSTESAIVKGSKEIAMPEGISISNINLGAPMNIVFYHDSDILRASFNDGTTSFTDPVIITLTEASTGSSRNVYVNPYGLIYSDL